jgi:hypothetical protein
LLGLKASHTLTKTHFIKGLQCPKALFLNVFKPRLKTPFSPETKALFADGRKFEASVRANFLPAVDVSNTLGPKFAAYAAFTKTCLAKEGNLTLFEAGLEHNKVLVLVDILKRIGNCYELYEIKRSTQLTPTILNDAALQYVVAKKVLQAPIQSFVILRVNDYDHQITDVSQSVAALAPSIETAIEEQLHLLAQGKEPLIATGPHCDAPYPCEFKNYCGGLLL